MGKKKVVYILGPIDRPDDADTYHATDDMLTALGYSTLGLALIPEGLGLAAETRIADAMIDSSDAVVLLPNWEACSDLVWLRHLAYCFGKPLVELRNGNPPEVAQAWLKHDLEEVLRHE